MSRKPGPEAPSARRGGQEPALLRLHPYFAPLPAAALAAVARRAAVTAYDRGQLIFQQGERGAGLYLVVTGSVRVFKASPEGKEQVLHHVGPGQSFNDVAALDGGPSPASAQALERTTVLVVGRDQLLELMRRHPDVAVAVVQSLSARLRAVSSLVEDLALRHVVSRVAAALLRLADGATVTLPTRQEFAAMVGTVREVVTRALGHLERQGAIRLEPRGRATILDRAVLERLSEIPPPPRPPGGPPGAR